MPLRVNSLAPPRVQWDVTLKPCFSAAALLLCAATAPAQAPAPRENAAQTMVQQAVTVELEAARNDHSLWRFRMTEKQEDDSVYDVVDTAQGEVKRKIQQAGHPLTPDQQTAEAAKVQAFVHDGKAQAKQRKDGEHDDASAAKMLNLLPRAFHWTVAGETAEQTTLHFVPDAAFEPPDIESRVLSAMLGDLVVDKRQHRITTMRGSLSHDVNIGYGLLGKLREGGTFNVERRQVAPNVWQITETHVHIDGRALLFKTIGQQTDEVKTDFKPLPPTTTLPQAAAMLNPR